MPPAIYYPAPYGSAEAAVLCPGYYRVRGMVVAQSSKSELPAPEVRFCPQRRTAVLRSRSPEGHVSGDGTKGQDAPDTVQDSYRYGPKFGPKPNLKRRLK